MIGIIGAMSAEVEALKAKIENTKTERISGAEFVSGRLSGKDVVVAQCGIGKVFAAICAQTMILRYGATTLINTGVAGTLSDKIGILDFAISSGVVQHDMDTTAIGDAPGLISGINKVHFDTDSRAAEIVLAAAERLGIKARGGIVASGDKFVAQSADKDRIVADFSADVCEMEGAAVAHTAFVNGTAFLVVRAISDSADGGANMDYMEFLPIAAKNSASLTLELIKAW
jgi:adenosylhomocysteine nucleosidase